jgi:type I restriction-modification system DNA methylase subunit
MPDTRHFLSDLDKKLWTAADKLRSNLDAAVYKHAVLGLIFLKCVSDSFEIRQNVIETRLRDKNDDYYLDPADYDSDADYDEAIQQELEERDYYIEENVFWVPALARWKTLQGIAPLPAGTKITIKNGKKGGQFYTLKSIVNLIVEMLEPFKGRVYDPAMGSGGFFVSSEKFIEEHGGKIGDVSVYGQESNPTTWRLAAINMAIRGIDFNFGKQPANLFTNDLHPDLRADYVLCLWAASITPG